MQRNKYVVYSEESVEVPIHLNFGQDMLDRCLQYGDNIALINSSNGDQLTFGELAQQAVNVALSLARMGVGKGDVVGICSEDRIEFTPTMLGVICAGACFTPYEPTGPAIVAHSVSMAQPKLVFISKFTYQSLFKVLQSSGVDNFVIFDEITDRPPQVITYSDFLTETCAVEDFEATLVDGTKDLAVLVFSSGTTGAHKGVANTHLSVMAESSIFVDHSYYIGKRALVSTEFLQIVLSCLHAGATLVFTVEEKADVILKAAEEYKVDILQAMPSILLQMVKQTFLERPYDVTSVQRVFTGAAAFDVELANAVRERFPRASIYQFYGTTESGAVFTDERAKLGPKPKSIGCVLPGVAAKVVDEETKEILGPNQRGELCIRCAGLFKGYIGLPDQLDSEGFYCTGDICYYDTDRYFYIVDRIKDIIKTSGFAVSPAQLESVLLSHAAVVDAGVVGVSDPVMQEVPMAYVVIHSTANVNESQLRDYANQQLTDWMRLQEIRFIDCIPRGVRGKVDRKALRKMYSDSETTRN